tara:strand:- start:371 stop:799 length:429 start_codon:yes stop_codon:yes gene_type:complete
MQSRRPILVALPLTLSLAVSLGGCMEGRSTAYSYTGMPGTAPMAPAPPANAVLVGRELRENDRTVDNQRDNPNVSRKEARGLRREQGLIGSLADRYGADGVLSDDERAEIEFRSRALQSAAANAPFTSDSSQSSGKPSKKPK